MKKKSNKQKGNEFESRIIKSINSGAISWQKGDARVDDYCIEIKGTDKKGYRLTTTVLSKIWGEALDANKLPLLLIIINDKENKQRWNLKVEIQKETIQ